MKYRHLSTVVRFLFLALIFVMSGVHLRAQVSVQPGGSALGLSELINGNGVQILNATINCADGAYGRYSIENIPGISSSVGLVLSTGSVLDAAGPNLSNVTTTEWFTPGDPQISVIAGATSFDACSFEFDVVPVGDTLRFNFTFASEEYEEYVGTPFNDAFAFLISGPGIAGDPGLGGFENIALVPNTSTAVSINSVNNGNPDINFAPVNPQFFVSNPISNTSLFEYDGYTTGLFAEKVLAPCDTFRLKLVIADVGDRKWDSSVFIEAIESNSVTLTASTVGEIDEMIRGCNEGTVVFTRSPVTGSPLDITYFIGGSAINGVDYPAIGNPDPLVPKSIAIPAGEASASIDILPFVTGTTDGPREIIFYIGNPLCQGTVQDSLVFAILDELTVDVVPPLAFLCPGDSVQFVVEGVGNNFSWTPAAGLNNAGIKMPSASPNASTTYTVTSVVSDCIASNTVEVRVSDIQIALNVTDIECGGANDGSIAAVVSGGEAPYEFEWQGPDGFTSTDLSINNLGPGTYTLTVTDREGCTKSTEASIAQNPPLVLELSSPSFAGGNNVSCNSASDGQAVVAVSGGTPGYTIQWNDPDNQSGSTAIGLNAGTYTVTVSDAQGCVQTGSITLTEPLPITGVLEDRVDVLCFGQSTGSLSIMAQGGTAPYNYLWNTVPPQTGPQANNIPAGIFSVTITDVNGCIGFAEATITEPLEPLTGSVDVEAPSCPGDSDATATASIAGGTPPYTYAWSNNLGNNSPSITGIVSGQYNLTVTDDNGCSISIPFNVFNPLPIAITPISVVDVDCFEFNTGSAVVSVTGGTGVVSLLWNTVPETSGAVLSGVEAGVYTVTATDENGCTASLDITIEGPEAPLSIDATVGNPSCNGFSDGSISLSANGGTAPYSFQWNTVPPTAGSDLSNLSEGSYSVTVTDANGCTVEQTYELTAPEPILIAVSNLENVLCFGDATGSATVSVSGGSLPYTITWNDPASQTGETAVNLAAGAYTVGVIDGNGCTASTGVVITAPTAPLGGTILQQEDVACFGDNDGLAFVGGTGGSGSYTYQWNDPNNQTGALATGLAPGTYTVSIFDANGCPNPFLLEVTIAGPSEGLDIEITPSIFGGGFNVACADDSTATLDLGIAGGTGPYTILWDLPGLDTSSDANLTDLAPGVYSVLVTDANGCTATAGITLTAPEAIEVTSTTTPSLCFGAPEGSIDISIDGGVPGYTANWAGPNGFVGTGLSLDNLEGGIYLLTVEDDNGCVLLESVTVIQPDDLTITVDEVTEINGFNTSCWNSQDASIFITPGGGTEPYAYTWNKPGNPGFSNQQDVANVGPGTYEVVLIDANGCVQNEFIDVIGPDPIVIDFDLSVFDNGFNISCNGEADGSITAVASGGTPGYTFFWIGTGGFGPVFGNPVEDLVAGEYSVLVRDANNCTFSQTITISEPPAFNISIFAESTNGNNIACEGESTGNVFVNVSGVSGPYTFSWEGPAGFTSAMQNITGVGAGAYCVTVTDINNCEENACITLTEPEALALSLTPFVYPNGGNLTCAGAGDGAISSVASGGNGPYTFSWTGPGNFSATTADISGLQEGTYCLVITDANGCEAEACATLEALPSLDITLSLLSTLGCNADADASIQATVAGGTAPFTLEWTGPNGFSANSLLIENLGPGTYCLTVTDDNDCAETECINVIAPSELSLSLVAASFPGGTNISCAEANDGSIAAIVAGGTAPYTYEWAGPDGFTAGTSGIANLPEGEYCLTLRDANDCEVQQCITLVAPLPLLANADVQLPQCNDGTNAQVSLEVLGGTPPYAYNWSTGDTSADIDLPQGSYTVVISDANNCSIILPVNVTLPQALVVTLQSPILPGGFNVRCNDDENGIINVFVTGGVGALTYFWSGTDNFGSSEAGLIGMPAGSYCVLVTDALGCSGEACITITEPEALDLNFDVQDALCAGGESGSITATAQGGVPTYLVTWNGPDGFSATGNTITGLAQGTYCATVSDLLGCTYQECVQVGEEEPITIILSSPEFDGVNITCFGANTGTIANNVAGGTPPYMFNWEGPNDFGFQGPNPDFLFAGEYCLTITDANGCEATECITLTQAEGVEIEIVANVFANGFNTSCSEVCDASLTTTLTGGAQPITLSWLGPDGYTSADADLEALCPGLYTLTTTDANGCTQVATVSIAAPPAIDVQLASPLYAGGTEISCFGFSNGAINANAAGGVGELSFNWSGPNGFSAVTQNLIELAAGTYTLEVVDATGCTAEAQITLNEPASALTGEALAFTFPSGTNISCTGANDGSISSTASGGTSPYAFNWLGPNDYTAQTADIDNLAPGFYTLVIEDANSCVFTINVELDEPEIELEVEATVVAEVLCHNAAQGAISLVANGGSSPYAVAWSGPAGFESTSLEIVDLVPGTYSYTVTDANGCSVDGEVTLSNELEITITAEVVNAICATSTGAISTAIAGGTPPYTFEWSNGGESQNLTEVPSGSYTLTVTDANGCEVAATFAVAEDNNLELEAATTTPRCNGDANGSILVSVVTGEDPITFAWEGPDGFVASGNALFDIGAGMYTLFALDANGCELELSYELTEPAPLEIGPLVSPVFPNGFNLTGFQTNDGQINAPEISGGTSPYSFAWSGPNNFVATGPGLQAGLGAGLYTLVVIDSQNCTDTAMITLTQPVPLQLPNGISPNGDGFNDGLIVRGLEDFPQNKIMIFNRWGNLLYEENNYSNNTPWAGTNNSGEQLPEGTYFVILELPDRDSLREYLELRR